jgi:hypothetical protein
MFPSDSRYIRRANLFFAAFLICVQLRSSAAEAQNPFVISADARPRVASGKIVTDAFDDSTGTLLANVRTFGWQFQTIPGSPYFLQDPGFNAVSSSGLPGGSQLGFNVTRGLSFWNGTGNVGFGMTSFGESLAFNFGAGTVSISSTTGAQSGFNFVTIAASGSAHRHLNSELVFGTQPTPAQGVYFTSIRLTNTGGPVPSDALFLLFNNGAAPADVSRALNYAANPFAGDADFSGTVNISDFATLASSFNRSGEVFWYDGDFNADYAVDIGDFSLLAANFNQSAPASLVRAVPEPSIISVSLVSLVALCRRRR